MVRNFKFSSPVFFVQLPIVNVITFLAGRISGTKAEQIEVIGVNEEFSVGSDTIGSHVTTEKRIS